jgi:hypothetical protein
MRSKSSSAPRSLALALAALLVLVACGERRERAAAVEDSEVEPAARPLADAPAAGHELDACALVTAREAAAALGVAEVEADRPAAANLPPHLSTCRYQAEQGAGVVVLTVSLRRGASAGEAAAGFAAMREPLAAAGGVEEIGGLGETAFWSAELEQLWVLAGPSQLGVSGDVPLVSARALAADALLRLD